MATEKPHFPPAVGVSAAAMLVLVDKVDKTEDGLLGMRLP